MNVGAANSKRRASVEAGSSGATPDVSPPKSTRSGPADTRRSRAANGGGAAAAFCRSKRTNSVRYANHAISPSSCTKPVGTGPKRLKSVSSMVQPPLPSGVSTRVPLPAFASSVPSGPSATP